jgi:hypothetical protein
LTPEEIDLMWSTVPPRTPLARPGYPMSLEQGNETGLFKVVIAGQRLGDI